MYIGQLGDGSDPKDGIYTMLKGTLVMAVDEFQIGFGKGFSVEVKENYAAVRDYGRGIPLKSVVSLTSGITVGIGINPKEITVHPIKVTNALSIDFYVASYRDGKCSWAKYSKGNLLEKGHDKTIEDKSPSLVRACLFVLIGETVRHFPGRRRSLTTVLLAALTLQLLFSPLSIRSVGFQLSYLAMAGIALVYPLLKDWYPAPQGGKNPFRWMWNNAALSVSCQVFTAPLVALRFGTFAPYFLLTNLLALPLTELLILSALATLLLGPSTFLPALTDRLASLLVRLLEIISTM